MVLCGTALGGCTSTSTVAPTPGFAAPGAVDTTAMDAANAGFTPVLPETVAVLPQPSAAVQVAAAGTEPAEAQPAAFAGATPQGSSAVVQAAVVEPAAGEAAPVADAIAEAVAEAAPATDAKPDATKVFPAAPVIVASLEPAAAVAPIAYAGAVPFYLAPTRPLKGDLPRTSVRGREDVETLIAKYAAFYELPLDLVRHVVNRESTFNPKAYNNGHWGLMQIKHATARGMGYAGPASGLFDAETNLKYAVKYLRGAWLVSGRNAKRADWLYQTGYYYEAKRQGMLEATGLGKDRKRRRARAEEEVRLDPEGIVRPPVGSSS